MKVKSNILALVGSMMLLPMNAQQLIIETTDTAITSNCLFATPEGEYCSLVFNSKGVATYDNKTTLTLYD